MSPVSSMLLLASLATAPVIAQAPQFVAEPPAGLAPFFAAQTVAFDFDGDGDVDLAMSGGALLGSCDRIYVNNGSGTFVAGPVLDCPFVFHNVVASDIDSDGDVDLMFTGGGLHVYENQGSLIFVDTTATVLAPGLANAMSVLAQGDFDGDGDEDFLADMNVVMVNVAGTLIAGATLPAQANMQNVAVADIDGDGDLDIARSGTATPVTLAINDGAASFADASNRLPSLTLSGWSVTLADLDGDRDPEILADGGLPTAPTVVLRNRDIDQTASAAVIGQAWQVEVGCRPGYATAMHPVVLGVGLARLPQPVSIPVLGDLWLDFGAPTLQTTGIVNAAVGKTVFTFAIPNAQGLIGVELHAQALVDRAPDQPRLSAFRSIVVQ